ncbi:MAG: hypothetical protein WDN45_04615 [Caulobacteraceae bacterium]
MRLLTACALAVATTAILTGPSLADSAADNAVTVAGVSRPKAIQEQTRRFTDAYAAATPQLGQIARWRDPVCVEVEGLLADLDANVRARVEDVAKAVGRHVETGGCRANIEIVFTEKPQLLMDGVARTRENLLGYYHRHDHAKLKAITRPIQAWYVTSTLGGGGNTNGAVFAYLETSGGVGGLPIQVQREVIDDPSHMSPTGCGDNPNFTACLQGVFKNVLVVADANQLKGKDIGLLSDYVVMLALSQSRQPDACGELPSVMDLFAASACPGRDPPQGLTPADAAYLTALYQADPEAKLLGQKGDISGRMARMLIADSARR